MRLWIGKVGHHHHHHPHHLTIITITITIIIIIILWVKSCVNERGAGLLIIINPASDSETSFCRVPALINEVQS